MRIMSIPKIWGWRFVWSASRGVAGTFYWTTAAMTEKVRGEGYHNDDFLGRTLTFRRALVLSTRDVGAFLGLPGEALATTWFPGRDFWHEAKHVFGTADDGEDGLLMDVAVAMEATRRGHDGIVYEEESLVDLRHLLDAGLAGPSGEHTLIRAIHEREYS